MFLFRLLYAFQVSRQDTLLFLENPSRRAVTLNAKNQISLPEKAFNSYFSIYPDLSGIYTLSVNCRFFRTGNSTEIFCLIFPVLLPLSPPLETGMHRIKMIIRI